MGVNTREGEREREDRKNVKSFPTVCPSSRLASGTRRDLRIAYRPAETHQEPKRERGGPGDATRGSNGARFSLFGAGMDASLMEYKIET